MTEAIHFIDQEAATAAFIDALEVSRRDVCLYASLLEPPLFDSQACIEALSHFARSARAASIHILIQDHKPFAVLFPNLVRLSQRLSAHIEIRAIPSDLREGTECYLVADARSTWRIPNTDRLIGSFEADDRVLASRYLESFHYYWQRSKQVSELRHLTF